MAATHLPAPMTSTHPEYPWWKKLVFGALAVALFFGFLEGLFYLCGVTPLLYGEDPYLGFSGTTPLFVAVEETGRMETAANKLRWFNRQSFLKRKAPGTIRIFCLGGSTTYGRPYEDPISFCGWLREMLPAADASKTYEVINAGGISYASYRLSYLMEELIAYEPDLFILYSGHNEFLEKRTYGDPIDPSLGVHADGVLARSRTFSVMRAILGPKRVKVKGSKAILEGDVKALLDGSVGPKDYVRDDPWRKQVQAHYRFNLNRMITMARSAGAKVLLVVPSANLRGCSPFKSELSKDLAAERKTRFNELLNEGRKAYRAGQAETGLQKLDEAIKVDGRHAGAHYVRGQILYRLKQFAEAKRAFQRAVDEDLCPLRILSSMQEMVREIAKTRAAALYDFAHQIEQQAPEGIPDASIFLDHVHCTAEGYRTLALGILDVLADRGWIKKSEAWNEEASLAIKERVERRIDKKAQGIALRNLAKVLSWAGKSDEAARLANRADSLLKDDPEAIAIGAAGAAAKGELEVAVQRFKKALALNPEDGEIHFNLGVALQKMGVPGEAAHHYREALRIQPKLVDAAVNLAVIMQQAGNFAEAIKLYKSALSHRPDYVEAHANLGRAYLASGTFEEAMLAFQEALRLKPEHLESRLGLADALAAGGRFKEAIPHYRKAVLQAPDHEGAVCNLTAALVENGQQDEGLQELATYVKRHPTAQLAARLLADLRKMQAQE